MHNIFATVFPENLVRTENIFFKSDSEAYFCIIFSVGLENNFYFAEIICHCLTSIFQLHNILYLFFFFFFIYVYEFKYIFNTPREKYNHFWTQP